MQAEEEAALERQTMRTVYWRLLPFLLLLYIISWLDRVNVSFAKLQMGQRAEIIPEAYPNLKYTGYIAEIAPEANRAKATVQVKVKVDNPDAQLRPEMNARVNFLAPESPGTEVKTSNAGTVMVPKSAITPVEKSREDAMKWILTAGLKSADAAPGMPPAAAPAPARTPPS